MKIRVFLIICLILIAGMVVEYNKLPSLYKTKATNPSSKAVSSTLSSLPTPTPSVLDILPVVEADGDTFHYVVYRIQDTKNLKLFANFKDQTSASKLFTDLHCQLLTNGSFYSKEAMPLGWFVSDTETLKERIHNQLIDGFFYQDKQGKVAMGFDYPERPVIWGIQAGPMLISENQPLLLEIHNDEPDRRVGAAISEQGDLFFFIVVGSMYTTSGPKLSQLPNVVKAIGKAEHINFNSAINLDGGSASVFLTKDIKLREQTYIGSYFCGQ